mgnify:CR=1 FL=1
MLLLAVVAAPVWAVEVASLYTAQVPLDPEESNPRAAAYEMALADVLLRVSGSELANDPEMIELLFPEPASYIVQFRPGVEETLWVSFDGEAIERVLRQAGQTVWGSDRPLTLVWLAVDWGQGEREIVAADDPDADAKISQAKKAFEKLQKRMTELARDKGVLTAAD